MALRCFGMDFISLAARGLPTNRMLPGTLREQTVSVYLITFKVKLKSCPNHVSSDLIKTHHTYCTALLIINKVNWRQKMCLFFSFIQKPPASGKLQKTFPKKTSKVWFLLEWPIRQYGFFLFFCISDSYRNVKREGFFFLAWQNTFPKFSKYCLVFASIWQSLGLTGIRLLNPHKNALEISG